MNDLRGEMRQQIDDVRNHINRNDQTDNDTTRVLETVRATVDNTRNEVIGVKNTVENKIGSLDSRLNEIKAIANDIRNKVH